MSFKAIDQMCPDLSELVCQNPSEKPRAQSPFFGQIVTKINYRENHTTMFGPHESPKFSKGPKNHFQKNLAK